MIWGDVLPFTTERHAWKGGPIWRGQDCLRLLSDEKKIKGLYNRTKSYRLISYKIPLLIHDLRKCWLYLEPLKKNLDCHKITELFLEEK